MHFYFTEDPESPSYICKIIAIIKEKFTKAAHVRWLVRGENTIFGLVLNCFLTLRGILLISKLEKRNFSDIQLRLEMQQPSVTFFPPSNYVLRSGKGLIRLALTDLQKTAHATS